jgi:hypothetical protein
MSHMDVGLVMMLVHQRDSGGGVLVVAPVLECCAGCGSTIACACGAHGCGICGAGGDDAGGGAMVVMLVCCLVRWWLQCRSVLLRYGAPVELHVVLLHAHVAVILVLLVTMLVVVLVPSLAPR